MVDRAFTPKITASEDLWEERFDILGIDLVATFNQDAGGAQVLPLVGVQVDFGLITAWVGQCFSLVRVQENVLGPPMRSQHVQHMAAQGGPSQRQGPGEAEKTEGDDAGLRMDASDVGRYFKACDRLCQDSLCSRLAMADRKSGVCQGYGR